MDVDHFTKIGIIMHERDELREERDVALGRVKELCGAVDNLVGHYGACGGIDDDDQERCKYEDCDYCNLVRVSAAIKLESKEGGA